MPPILTKPSAAAVDSLDPAKFSDPDVTADGSARAQVALMALKTLWFNTGTLCNLTCTNCYIESSPRNDSLTYLSRDDVRPYLDEIGRNGFATEEIGFTGGEPFMNPNLMALLEDTLSRGYRALVLTNAMRPMMKCADGLLALKQRYGGNLALRVSIDHYGQSLHELERREHAWRPALNGLSWLAQQGFAVTVAGRTRWGESERSLRRGYAALFAKLGLGLDAEDRKQLVLFPEMDAGADVPEITTACWDTLQVSPNAMMCATSRMVVKRKGEDHPVVLPCTLLPYDRQFELGRRLAESETAVKLNHPHCARFCVLGGGACS